MKYVLGAVRDLVFAIRLNSDRILAVVTVIFALCLGAYLGTLFFPF
jgi:hypothetical protein